MTEREICIMYREARNQNTQLQVLAELNDVSRNEIIRILVKNGEKLPPVQSISYTNGWTFWRRKSPRGKKNIVKL